MKFYSNQSANTSLKMSCWLQINGPPRECNQHQYFVTETIPEVANLGRRLPAIADHDGEYYFRQEGLGFLIGGYERNRKFWFETATPRDFGYELLPDDLGRIEENVMRAINRVPTTGTADIKRVINGPMI